MQHPRCRDEPTKATVTSGGIRLPSELTQADSGALARRAKASRGFDEQVERAGWGALYPMV